MKLIFSLLFLMGIPVSAMALEEQRHNAGAAELGEPLSPAALQHSDELPPVAPQAHEPILVEVGDFLQRTGKSIATGVSDLADAAATATSQTTAAQEKPAPQQQAEAPKDMPAEEKPPLHERIFYWIERQF